MTSRPVYPAHPLWQPSLEATLEHVLKTQVRLAPKFTVPRWRPSLQVLSRGYAALIDAQSSLYTAKLGLWVPSDPLSDILLAMTGDVGGPEEYQSAVCEFLNMIYGGAKRTLTDEGFEVPMAIPKPIDTDQFNAFTSEELIMGWPPRGTIRMRLLITPS